MDISRYYEVMLVTLFLSCFISLVHGCNQGINRDEIEPILQAVPPDNVCSVLLSVRARNTTEALNIDNTGVCSIAPHAWSTVTDSVRCVDLSANQISQLTAADVAGLERITSLALARNRIQNIAEDTRPFERLSHLESLDLSLNQLNAISRDAFRGLRRLRTLGLGGNALTKVDAESFKPLNLLEELDLSYNPVEFISSTLENLPSLTSADLSRTFVKHVPTFLENLESLNLRQAHLTTVEPEEVLWLAKLKTVSLGLNPFNCTCDLLPFAQYLSLQHNIDDYADVWCRSPFEAIGIPVTQVVLTNCAQNPNSLKAVFDATVLGKSVAAPKLFENTAETVVFATTEPEAVEVTDISESTKATESHIEATQDDTAAAVTETTESYTATADTEAKQSSSVAPNNQPITAQLGTVVNDFATHSNDTKPNDTGTFVQGIDNSGNMSTPEVAVVYPTDASTARIGLYAFAICSLIGVVAGIVFIVAYAISRHVRRRRMESRIAALAARRAKEGPVHAWGTCVQKRQVVTQSKTPSQGTQLLGDQPTTAIRPGPLRNGTSSRTDPPKIRVVPASPTDS